MFVSGQQHADTAIIRQACLASGRTENVCACVVREANSRFTHDEIVIVGAAMPRLELITDNPALAASLPADRRLSEDQLRQLRQRVEAADSVIRRACGAGLRLDEPS